MDSLQRICTVVLAVLVALMTSHEAIGDRYLAYSLNRAEELIRDGRGSPDGLKALGGITDPLAIVYDADMNDLIIVGRVQSARQSVSLDDFVVAFRSVFKDEMWPMVSIDKTETTEKTGKQEVRFLGGIENTPFGKTLLDADVLLKKIALGEIPAEAWGVRSYFERRCDQAKKTDARGRIRTRFWLTRDKDASTVVHSGGACAIETFQLRVQTHVVSNLAHKSGGALFDDKAGEDFASSFSACYGDLGAEFPVLKRVKRLFLVLGLASGLRVIQQDYRSFEPQSLAFWLDEYEVSAAQTPTGYPLIEKERMLDHNGKNIKVELDGGIELKALVLEIRDGSIDALRDFVVKLRPDRSALTWEVRLDECGIRWDADGMVCADLDNSMLSGVKAGPGARACTLDGRIFEHDGSRHQVFGDPLNTLVHLDDNANLASSPPLATGIPLSEGSGRLSRFSTSSDIGGVMLAGTAEVEGAERAEVSLAGGSFSLVVDGKNARIDPKLFRKFVTALWCVYYSDQDPGISIDPVAPDVDKHLVRYIGRVINTDLGRVMRQADYRMKKWAVGTERPDVAGFRDVDAWAYSQGRATLASRRFWFVPENLRFKRAGDLLLFASGRMRVRTEFLADGLRGQAAPSDEAFAGFFTEHYDEIAEKYPAYKELFEYAKLVALAKYLKEQGVPLHWFLLAHKDLVLTEDSPGTVAQLAKGSEYFQGLTIQGGVNLGAESQYVFDAEAVAAINKALAARRAAAPERAASTRQDRRMPPVQPVSFEAGRRSYTVLPQHTLTSGKDHRGTRYQTDLALRESGQPGLELVRYYDPRNRQRGQFGAGWHLLIPYRVKPADEATREFLNAIIPQRMIVENLVSGQQEVLTFSPDRYAAAGYVPDTLESSQVIGLFLMSNGSFRLADKLGNQFHFDPGGRMTDMFLSPSPEHHMHVEYVDRFTGAFVEPPYVARPVGEQRVDFLNARIPKQVRVMDRVRDCAEVLTFRDDNEPAGYVPEDEKASRFHVLALLSNGGLQLVDKHGNEIRFTPGWDFEAMLPARNRQMVRSISMGSRKATFGYTIDSQGQVVVATAALSENEPLAEPTWVVRYEYDDDGRLCRVRRPEFSVARRPQEAGGHLALAGISRPGAHSTWPASRRR